MINNMVLERGAVLDDLLRVKKKRFGYSAMHVGCGNNNLFEDFVNCDIDGGECYLDATDEFPVSPNSVDYIYSEHFIEHIKFSQAEVFLKESLKALRNGGINRILFPDLRKLIDVALHEPELAEQFRERSVKGVTDGQGNYIIAPKATPLQGVTWDPLDDMVNNFTHYWGHKYIWSADHLRRALLAIGYNNVEIKNYGEGDVKALVKDPVNRWGQRWTSVIEAVK